MSEEAISMEPVREKLRNLPQYMPKQERIVYDFASYLAEHLNDELVPQGFALATELALYDIEQGVDSRTRKPIGSNLAGYPSMIYTLLRMSFPYITEAVCPPEFAKGVKDFIEEVNDSMKK